MWTATCLIEHTGDGSEETPFRPAIPIEVSWGVDSQAAELPSDPDLCVVHVICEEAQIAELEAAGAVVLYAEEATDGEA